LFGRTRPRVTSSFSPIRRICEGYIVPTLCGSLRPAALYFEAVKAFQRTSPLLPPHVEVADCSCRVVNQVSYRGHEVRWFWGRFFFIYICTIQVLKGFTSGIVHIFFVFGNLALYAWIETFGRNISFLRFSLYTVSLGSVRAVPFSPLRLSWPPCLQPTYSNQIRIIAV
jgi:hypothetical protein